MTDTPKRDKIAVRNLYKVFGDHPQEGMRLIREGRDKDEIFAETGQTVGVVDANFTIREGEIFVIMGLSGSGKSTMVRMFNRLYEPTSGSIEIDGEDIVKLDNEGLRKLRRDTVSMVFQSFALMPHMKVIDNVAFGLELGGISRHERHRRAMTALEQVGLAANADSYPDELSGGMQQRVGLARALCADPPILLMDEAFSALDPLIRSEMQDELLMLQEEKQRTIIFISHDLDEAMRIGDRIAIMQGGVVVQVGTPEEILKNPANDYVRSFFRGVDVSKVLTARDIARRTQVTLIDKPEQGPRAAIRTLESHDREYGYVIGRNRRFLGVASLATLDEARKADQPLEKALLPDCPTISPEAHLGDLMNVVATTPYAVPVIDENGRYAGAVSRSALLQALDNMITEDKPAMAAAADPVPPQNEAREGV
ncbi:glycine betaine/L-proline ABC transporter ATP-binding protein ProV [Saliniramus sp.]|uniref:glycine betaine/L-proline ABC transporter ATP-binding protein ProV n=1 Tax=Saliniramus sp. TaxID=2986772 RepID=UPI002BBDE847|nr:glycine betaine/L-proline ABC transporter ATP-binding protein ProV [Saliniramus sp.]HMB11609.1 glycine betaine/L-proline ABC transporter ATP-binding protein ProV [Saliniramus sp.]